MTTKSVEEILDKLKTQEIKRILYLMKSNAVLSAARYIRERTGCSLIRAIDVVNSLK